MTPVRLYMVAALVRHLQVCGGSLQIDPDFRFEGRKELNYHKRHGAAQTYNRPSPGRCGMPIEGACCRARSTRVGSHEGN